MAKTAAKKQTNQQQGQQARPPAVQGAPAGNSTSGLILMGDKHDVTHLNTGAQARGNENVAMDDLVIPRLEIVQGLSPAVKPNDPGYIEGARQGDLINSVTNQNYGREVFLVNVHYAKLWLVWKKYSEGGGFFGAFPGSAEAEARAEEEGGKRAHIEVVDTPQHLCLIIDRANNRVDEIMLALARTKAKVSRAWNTMIRLTGQDRFARVYRITTALEKNKKGQEYYNFVVAQTGFAAKPLFQHAERLYTQITKGERNVVMDTKGYGATGEPGEDANSEM